MLIQAKKFTAQWCWVGEFFMSCMQTSSDLHLIIFYNTLVDERARTVYLTIQYNMNKSPNELDIKSLKTHWINYTLIWLHFPAMKSIR